MKLDLLAAIELTGGAAFAVAVLSLGLGTTARARWRWAAGLSVWFLAVVVLAATQALNQLHGLGTPGLGVVVLTPVVAAVVAARRPGEIRRALDAMPLSWLVGVNAIRVEGVNFVLLYAAHRLPASFALAAGFGDIVVGLAALPVAGWLAARGAAARPVALAWNIIGLVDLIDAVALGVASSPGPLHLIAAEPSSALITTLPWLLIPGFVVPLLTLTHLAVFARLARRQPAAGAAIRSHRAEALAA